MDMKKQFTVLALTLALALVASSAMASLTAINSSIAGGANTDGAKYRVAGFQISNNTQYRALFVPAMITGNLTLTAGISGGAYVNQSLYVRNSSAATGVVYIRTKNSSLADNGGPHGLKGFVGMKRLNATGSYVDGVATGAPNKRGMFNSTRWLAFSPSGTFFASVDNATYNASSSSLARINATNGTMLFTGVHMVSGGKAKTVLANGDVWYFYQVLMNSTTKSQGARGLIGWREGSFQKISGSADPYTARVYWSDSLNSTIRTASDFSLRTVAGGGIRLYKGNTVLLANGTMDNSTKIIIGAGPDQVNGTMTYTIALKGASIMSQGDFARGWNILAAGAEGGNSSFANAAAGAHKAKRVFNIIGVLAAQNDATSTVGASMVGRLLNSNSTGAAQGGGAMFGTMINLASEQAKVTIGTVPSASSYSSAATGIYTRSAVGQTQIAIKVNNATRFGSANVAAKDFATMRGRWLGAADGVFAGIYLGNNTYNRVGIAVALAKVAVAGDVSNATSTSTNASGVIRYVNTFNGSERGSAGVKGINYYGWSAVQTRYGLSGYTPLLTNWVTFNASVKGYDASKPVYTFNYPVSGLSINKVSNLALLKINNSTLSPTAGAPARGSSSAKAFSYAGSKALIDGNWWLSETQGGAAVATDQPLDPMKTYFVTVAIADNGGYDLHPTGGIIFDPSLLTSYVPASSSSSSSTGCVFNPTAGFGLEWLLLLIAPALGIVRSRLKK